MAGEDVNGLYGLIQRVDSLSAIGYQCYIRKLELDILFNSTKN